MLTAVAGRRNAEFAPMGKLMLLKVSSVLAAGLASGLAGCSMMQPIRVASAYTSHMICSWTFVSGPRRTLCGEHQNNARVRIDRSAAPLSGVRTDRGAKIELDRC